MVPFTVGEKYFRSHGRMGDNKSMIMIFQVDRVEDDTIYGTELLIDKEIRFSRKISKKFAEEFYYMKDLIKDTVIKNVFAEYDVPWDPDRDMGWKM